MGKTYNWELSKTESDANQHSLAQTYLELYLRDKKPEEIAPTQAIFDGILARPRVELSSGRRIEWWWCDALFMAPGAWARMYAATGDKKYIDVSGRGVGEDLAAALGPGRAPLLSRRYVYREDGEEWAEDLLVARRGLGDGGAGADAGVSAEGRSSARDVRDAAEGDGRRGGEDAGAGRPVAGGDARSGGLRSAGDLGLGADDVWDGVGREQRTAGQEGVYAGDREGVGGDGVSTSMRMDGWETFSRPGRRRRCSRPRSSWNYGVGGFLLAGSEVYKMAGGKAKR